MDPGSEAGVTFKRARDDLLFVGVHPCGRWFDVAVRVPSPTVWALTNSGTIAHRVGSYEDRRPSPTGWACKLHRYNALK